MLYKFSEHSWGGVETEPGWLLGYRLAGLKGTVPGVPPRFGSLLQACDLGPVCGPRCLLRAV